MNLTAAWGGVMGRCEFDKLVRYLDKQLTLDEQLGLFDHLDHCEVCREAIYLLSRDRDAAFFIFRPYRVNVNAVAS